MKRRSSKPAISRRPSVVIARILDAAQAEFMAFGYEGASTNRITDSFQGSKATLFRYFPTKEAMLEGVIRRIAGRWREAVVREEIPNLAPRAWLELFAARTLSWILSEEPLFLGRLGIAEGHKMPKLARVFEETASEPLRTPLARQLKLWTKHRLLNCKDPQADAVHFLDLLIGGPVSRALYRTGAMSKQEKSRHLKRGVDLFLGGCALHAATLPDPTASTRSRKKR